MKIKLSLICLIFCLSYTLADYEENSPFPGQYVVTSLEQNNKGATAYLNFTGSASTYLSNNNYIIKYLKFEMSFDSESELVFKITDAQNYRFTLPYNEPYPFTKVQMGNGIYKYGYDIAQINETFWLTIYRLNFTNEVIFSTQGFEFIYTNMFIQITTQMQNEKIYGLGERRQHFLYNSGQYSIWNKDQYMTIDNGQPNGQLYGSHPMYLRKEQSGNYHVSFLRNPGGMLITYQQNNFLQYQLMAGIIEFKLFLGDNHPDNAIKMYHTYINGFALHPFWAQGYHQCKWGWNTSQQWYDVWQTFNNLSLPLDTLWNDIDYMIHYQDFTIDLTRYNTSQMKIVTNMSDPLGVHWVPILDAGVAINTNANYEGLSQNAFLQSTEYPNNPLYGCVWPGITNFIDLNQPNSSEYWYEGANNLTQVYNTPQPSGFWIDMNEYSNFGNGECSINGPCSTMGEQIITKQHQQKKGFLEKVDFVAEHISKFNLQQDEPIYPYPFSPTGPNHPLDEKTLSMNATHYNDEDSPFLQIPNYNITEYDFHNLNGFLEGINTFFALKNMKFEFPFIISRSTLFGSGKYVQHWTGDNGADWIYLQLSLSEIFNFQLFGIPMTGVDICGFAGNSSAELCARWMQVGLFYPFSRNHGANDTTPHLPYSFPNYPYVLQSSQASMFLRYRLLKYYYHLFVKLNSTGSVFKPIFFEYNDDNLDALDTQFMIGDLMIAPVLYPGNTQSNTTNINVYFPVGSIFYNFYNGTKYQQGNFSIIVPFNATVPMYIKQGKIVHYQNFNVLRSRNLTNQFMLAIAFDSSYKANGTILSANDYNNHTQFMQNCVKHNCVLNLTASGIRGSFSFQLTLNATGSQPNTVFDQILIQGVYLYGLNNNQIIQYNLPKPWNITKPSNITFSIMI